MAMLLPPSVPPRRPDGASVFPSCSSLLARRSWSRTASCRHRFGFAHTQSDIEAYLSRASLVSHRYLSSSSNSSPATAPVSSASTTATTPIAWFAHRRIREKPPSGGVSVLCESVAVDPMLKEYAERLLRAAEYRGVAMVEFRIGTDGRPYLMEVNARFWGSLQLAIDCGVDFPWLYYQMLMGEKVEPVHELPGRAPAALVAGRSRPPAHPAAQPCPKASTRSSPWSVASSAPVSIHAATTKSFAGRTQGRGGSNCASGSRACWVVAVNERPATRLLHLIDTGGPGGAETVFAQVATGLRPAATAGSPS